jgi:hypothetical protein
MRRLSIQADGRSTARPQRARGSVVFRYRLLDLGGREVDVIERQAPLRPGDTVILTSTEPWRIVAVLGRSATVVRP